jgi:Domain of unknown function (DUF4382)
MLSDSLAKITGWLKRFFCCITAALLIAVCISAPRPFAAESNHGVLEIQIKDHRDAIGDFTRLNIVIDSLLISPKAGLKFWQAGWQELESTATIDLTRYVGKKTARVYRGEINAGSFDGFHLKIKNIDALLKKNRHAMVKNTVGPVKINFQVPANGKTLLVFDLVVTDFSDHPPRGYELAIKGYEIYTNGKLMEKIPPA